LHLQEWCKKKQFADGDTVNEGKLLLWMTTDILKKGNQVKRKEKDAEGSVSHIC
jgi:hypothetical protein